MFVAGAPTSRRARAATAVAALCLIAGVAAGGPGASAQGAERPNFIVIMADDLGPEMMAALPSVRKLVGSRGATFESALASYPLCCPARATLLTGQFAHNHGAKGNNPKSGGGYRALVDPERNLAAWLDAAGYDTAFAGKWLNGLRTPRKAPPGWNQWWGLIGEGGEGLSSFYDYEIFDPSGTPRHFGTRAADYQTDALTREFALPFVDEHAADPDPFFLWLAYHPPHGGLGRNDAAGRRCSSGPPSSRRGSQSAIPAPRHAGRFARIPLPNPPSFDEANVVDKPAQVRRRPRLDDANIERIERDYRCGLAALLSLDDAVEDIVSRLKQSDQIDNTVVVFTADHGVLAGEHRIARGKNQPYEEAIGVPLVIRGPGIEAHRRIEAPVVNADLAPTILDIAGAVAPPELARPIDGISLEPVLAGGSPATDRAILIEGRDNVARARHGFKVRSYVGVRTRRYAYFEHRRANYASDSEGRGAPIGAGRVTDRELYDLGSDPFELRSRDRDPDYAATRRELARLVARLEDCSGATCAQAVDPPAPSR